MSTQRLDAQFHFHSTLVWTINRFKCCKSDSTVQAQARATAPIAEPVKQEEVETKTEVSETKEEEVAAEEEAAKKGYNCCGL
jgi:hypothetical protein